MRHRATTADLDSVTAPWANMANHRVAGADDDRVTAKIRNLLALRRTGDEHGLWGKGPARDRVRARSGGTKEPGDPSSVLESSIKSGRRGLSPGIVRLVPLVLRKIVTR